MNPPETNTLVRKTGKNGEAEPFPKPWFCVAVSAPGSTVKQDADSPDAFVELLNHSPLAWVDYRTEDFDKEAQIAAQKLGFSDLLVTSLTGNSHLTYQDFDTEMGLKIPSVQVRDLQVQPYPLLFLIRKNFILTVHPLNVDRRFNRLRRYSDTVLRKIPVDACSEDKLTMLLIRIIDENNERNFEHLREIEERGDELNKELIDPRTPREKLGPDIYHMKHALITYLNALWESLYVLHALRYGDAELTTNDPNLLGKMTFLAEDVNRQIGLAEHMSEVLASGLEVLQSIYNNQLQALNNRLALVMTYLTIIGTAVLVPNTLATIFSNSAFGMTSDDIWWYVPTLVVSTIAATGLSYWWVTKMGWMPKKVD